MQGGAAACVVASALRKIEGKRSLADPVAFEMSEASSLQELLSRFKERGLALAVLIDSVTFPDLRIVLEQARMEYHSLFSGPDDEILESEAPVLVPLSAPDCAFASRLAQMADADFICIGYFAETARIVRHLKGWLSVHLPLTAPERSHEDKPVLFRFYDPRILTLFLATLTPQEAVAYCGPIEAWGASQPVAQSWYPTAETLASQPSVRRPELFRIRSEQYKILAQHASSVFEEALQAYLRDEFELETTSLDDDELDGLIAQATRDGRRLGDTRPGSVATLAVLHLLRPDLMSDEFIWAEVMGGNPEGKNPMQRVGLFSAYHTIDLPSIEAFEAYHASLARFWEFY